MTTEKFAFSKEAGQRQQLTLVALGKRPAHVLIRGVTLLNVFSLEWFTNYDIVINEDRIAWIGSTGLWNGEVETVFDRTGLFAVPGFGEPHKHIESTHLTPEYEAALVLPDGNTWTVEASHEFSNASGSPRMATSKDNIFYLHDYISISEQRNYRITEGRDSHSYRRMF